MKKRCSVVFVLLALSIATFAQQPRSSAAAQKPAISAPPATPKRPVIDKYDGVTITDDYRWLEQNNTPEVRAWVEAQNARARGYFDALPEHAKIYDWIKTLSKSRSTRYGGIQAVAGLLFALKSAPGMQQDVLVTLHSPDDLSSEHLVMDPNASDRSGRTAIQFFSPSFDGKQVAICLAEGGSEAGNVRVYEVATGKALADMVPNVNLPTAGGSIAWKSDGSGFYYTRYPQPGERPKEDLYFYQQVYFHKLGSPTEQDQYVLGKDFPRIAETSLSTSGDGKYLLATVENGDGGEYQHYLLDPQGKWTQLTHYADQISAITFGHDDALYMVSRKQALRGKMLRLPLATPDLSTATVIVPESEAVIEGFYLTLAGFQPNFLATKDRLYVVETIGGPQQVRMFDLKGKPLGLMPIEPVSSVSSPIPLANGDVLFRNRSYLKPSGWYIYHPQTGKSTATVLRSTSPVDFSDVEAVRETAVSKDGTKIPLTVIRKKGMKFDSKHPTILTGYGGYSLSLTPGFDPELRIWLDAGGVYAIANLRGGGEFGEAWHKNGMLTKKQNVFDDFIACAEHLVQSKYTNPKQLGIAGGSNGGLLMGAVLTQRPEFFRAVYSAAGVYDMLRSETTQNGQFNATEYGSVKDPAQFKALCAYSPYHHVVSGTKYPAVLLTVGENDMRVDPWHSRKFAAKLQADTASGLPIFLISFSNAGHGGIGVAEDLQIAMSAYEHTFFFDQLGARFVSQPPGATK